MPRFINLVGQTFGYWTVIERAPNHNYCVYWKCRCRCGTVKNVVACGLRTGHTASCGCAQKEGALKFVEAHGFRRCKSSTYAVWQGMKQRCFYKKSIAFHRYGGRGITVCERWMSFDNFLSDMGKKPPGLSLERINNNGNYEPSNCKWATRFEQGQNTVTNRVVEFNGKKFCVSEWERQLGFPPRVLLKRLGAGIEVNEAFTRPLKVINRRPRNASV